MKFFIPLFAFSILVTASEIEHPEDGTTIPEPFLYDYQYGSRSPGILVEPYEIEYIESN